MANEKRILKRNKITFDEKIDFATLNDAIKNLQELAEKYGGDKIINVECFIEKYGSVSAEHYIYVDQIETDEEFELRMKMKRYQEEQERETLARLKKKYEK